MKNNNLPYIVRIVWAALVVATLIARNWKGDAATAALIIVALGWVAVRIITEGIAASVALMKSDEDEE